MPKAANLTPPADPARHRLQGGDIISESGGDYFSEQGGGIISELGGGFPRNLHRRIGHLVACAMRVFYDRFSIAGQIVSVALHLDERTPHVHVVVVPLTREPNRRRRDQAPVIRLFAKRVVGGRGDMSREQTRFASFFVDMGLERGVERSGARHVSNREHEAMLERARQEAIAERETWSRERGALDEERAAFEQKVRTRRAELDQREAAIAEREADAERIHQAAHASAAEDRRTLTIARREVVEAKKQVARLAATIRAEQDEARKLREAANAANEEGLCLRDEAFRFP